MTETVGSTATPKRGRPDKQDKRAEKLNLAARSRLFVRQIVAELRKVVWPSRNDLMTYTWVVLIFVVVVMGIVFGLDYGLQKAVFAIFG